jgi:hypothetical protein
MEEAPFVDHFPGKTWISTAMLVYRRVIGNFIDIVLA